MPYRESASEVVFGVRTSSAVCGLALMAAALASCAAESHPPLPKASEAGRRACVEEVQANYPGQQRFGAMRQCLSTIDARIRQQQALNQQIEANQQPAASTAGQSSAHDRYIYCRLHQSEIQAAERERQRAQGAWSEASGKETPGSLAFEDARQDYEDSVAELERLIPESMRSGLPLIPDAIRQFMTCQFNPVKAD